MKFIFITRDPPLQSDSSGLKNLQREGNLVQPLVEFPSPFIVMFFFSFYLNHEISFQHYIYDSVV